MNKISIISIILLLQILPVNISATEFHDPFATPDQNYIDPFSAREGEIQDKNTNPAFVQAAKERERNKITQKMYQCMLDNLQNVGSDVAAEVIVKACRELNRQ